MNAMLAHKIEEEERAIHYVTKKFLKYKIHYIPLQKIALALVSASKKHIHCMLTNTIHVIVDKHHI